VMLAPFALMLIGLVWWAIYPKPGH
jgi:hypothetical protein